MWVVLDCTYSTKRFEVKEWSWTADSRVRHIWVQTGCLKTQIRNLWGARPQDQIKVVETGFYCKASPHGRNEQAKTRFIGIEAVYRLTDLDCRNGAGVLRARTREYRRRFEKLGNSEEEVPDSKILRFSSRHYPYCNSFIKRKQTACFRFLCFICELETWKT